MRGHVTDRVLTAYRIGDPNGQWPIWSAEGARQYPGRWNTFSSPLIYTSEHYSTAMLEKLVQGNGLMPVNQHFIEITLPDGLSYEVFRPEDHPGWDGPGEAICKRFGEQWVLEARSVLLIVPSIPARVEDNFLINPAHPEIGRITFDLPRPVWWDNRLFG